MHTIASERQRQLAQLAWVSGAIISRDLPRDTILKQLQCRLSGSATYTFSSTPVAFETGSFDNLVQRIDIVVNGGRVVKSVRPWLQRLESALAFNSFPERKASTGASIFKDNNPQTDAGWNFGSSTNYTTVAESIPVHFEMVLSGKGRSGTYLNLKGASSAECRMQCGTVANLDKTTNSAITLPLFNIELTTIEAQDIPANTRFSDWKQTVKEVVITGASTDFAIDLNRGNFLAGIKLFCVQDQAMTQSTASFRKQPNNFGIDTIKLVLNGSQLLKVTTFNNLQAENRRRFGVTAAYASSQSQMDGFAYLDMLEVNDSQARLGDLQTALDCRPPKVDNLQLLVTTKAADATYNNYNLSITVETGEIVQP